jgi:outer membrane assembly lipoprotein YfiO
MRCAGAVALAVVMAVGMCLGTAQATWVYSKETGKLTRLESAPRETALEQFKYAGGFEEAGKWTEALREYRKVVRYFPDSILAAQAQFKVAEMYEKLERFTKAFEQYQVVLDKYPSFRDPDEVIARQFRIASAFYGGRKRAMPLLHLRILPGRGKAIQFYEQITRNAPFSALAEESKYRAGELLEATKRYEDYSSMDGTRRPGAISTYLYVVDNFEDGERCDDALYRVAECYYKKAVRARHDKKALEQAMLHYRRYARDFPKGEFAAAVEARIAEVDHRRATSDFEVARYYEQRGKYGAALIYYESLVKRFPLSPYAEQAEAKAAEMRKRLGVEPGGDDGGASGAGVEPSASAIE